MEQTNVRISFVKIAQLAILEQRSKQVRFVNLQSVLTIVAQKLGKLEIFNQYLSNKNIIN